MRERLHVHTPAALRENAIVTNRCRCRHCFVDISRLEHVPLTRAGGPDTCVAVGLELHSYRQRIRLPRIRLLQLANLRVSPGEVLNMMPQLVREHVRLREITSGAVTLLQI